MGRYLMNDDHDENDFDHIRMTEHVLFCQKAIQGILKAQGTAVYTTTQKKKT